MVDSLSFRRRITLANEGIFKRSYSDLYTKSARAVTASLKEFLNISEENTASIFKRSSGNHRLKYLTLRQTTLT
jgi:hypothetical protein